MSTRSGPHVLERVGATLPIIQAPMAGAGSVDLAIGAIRGGGVGSLPCALIAPDEIGAQVAAVRQAASGPINLNFFCHDMPDAVDESAWIAALAPYYREYDVRPPTAPPPLRMPFDAIRCAAVEQARPEIVSFHFGLPDAALMARIKATDAVVIASATTIAEARWLAAHDVDAVIAQGFEAGGHSGRFLPVADGTEMGLFALLPQIVDAVDVPVIAAGGIADMRGARAAMALGASAIQIGTAYLLSPESSIGATHRHLLASEAAERTRMTNMISGRPARGLPNRLIDEMGPTNAIAPPFPFAGNALTELRRAAEARGRTDFSTQWSGQAARLAATMPAEALTRLLGHAALTALARAAEEEMTDA